MASFEDIGFMLMNIAKACNVDAARIVTGDTMATSAGVSDLSGFHIVASEPLYHADGTPARLVLLTSEHRQLSTRERARLRALALQAQTQLSSGVLL